MSSWLADSDRTAIAMIMRLASSSELTTASTSADSDRLALVTATRELLLHVLGELGELALETFLRDADGVLVAADQRLGDLLRHGRLHVRRQRDDLRVGCELEQHRLVRPQCTIPCRADVLRVVDPDAFETEQTRELRRR